MAQPLQRASSMISQTRRQLMVGLGSVLGAMALMACTSTSGYSGGSPGGYSGGAAGAPGGGGIGVTPGGVQDINYAREQVEAGTVPPADAITVEGLLSQHDLPTVGEPCTDLMCLRPALAVAPSLETGESAFWLHLGMTSGLTDFERPPMDLTIVIDHSDSMSIDMDETNEAAIDMLRQLGPDDRASVIAFNDSTDVVIAHGPVTDLEEASTRIRAIRAEGAWDIDVALADAVAIQRAAGNTPERLRRVVVLSCGYPNANPSGRFADVAREAGDERIGFTFVGILLGFEPALGDLLGQTRGGNYFYAQGLEDVTHLFDEEFDFMMSPLAYDLSIALDLGPGFVIDRAFGIPGDSAGTPGAAIEVATAFPSRRRGGIVVRLRATEAFDQNLGNVALSYEPESAHGWEGVHDEGASLTLPESVTGATSEVYWGSDGARKAVALVNAAERLATACGQFHAGDRADASATLTDLTAYLRGEAEALDDDGLRDEVAFVEALAALM